MQIFYYMISNFKGEHKVYMQHISTKLLVLKFLVQFMQKLNSIRTNVWPKNIM
jgi:hypothetical protein